MKMYKTVRHGENSLQYKILAQQEEGIININVKCRKTKKRKIAGIIVIVVFLVCGIIASAVLIPLVLANDFITLTGTFQKFSVSTLRRTHSGNHVVVIAKKPHGWIASRQSVLQSNQFSNTSALNSKKENFTERLYDSKKVQKYTSEPKLKTSLNLGVNSFNGNITNNFSGRAQTNNFTEPTKPLNFDFRVFTTKYANDGFIRNKSSPTKAPLWNSTKDWSFKASSNFTSWTKKKILNHPVLTGTGTLIAVVISLYLALLIKNFLKKKKTKQEESVDLNEDKTKLLKSPMRGSDEE